VGDSVDQFQVGDRVFGDLFNHGAGAFAEYVCASQRAFERIPDEMSFETAATLPHSAVLALQGLRTRRGRTVGAHDRVLIVGASGNVGPFAVQIAKARGAHVTGVASAEKLDFVRSLGADAAVDYESTDYTRPAEPYDWIVDVDAHHPLRRWPRALKRGGTYVAMGGSGGWLISLLFWAPVLRLLTGKRLGLLLSWRPFHRADLDEIARLISTGAVRPVIDRRFALDDVVAALHWVADGKPRGKVLVVPTPGNGMGA
jgi:NADPH:quinone reductase-like Zn-dependent oxidoreductase